MHKGSNSKDLNVYIIGAGIVGLYLAQRLEQVGIHSVIYDGKSAASERAERASGILSKSGLERIGLGELQPAKINTLNGAVLFAHNEKMRIVSKQTQAYVLDRKILAQLMFDRARDSGVEIHMGHRKSAGELREMAAEKNSILIGADGAVSSVASAFNFPAIEKHVLTYKAEYFADEISDLNLVGLYFSNSFAHGLFGWHVPYSDKIVELGLGIDMHYKISSSVAFERFLETKFEKFKLKSKISGHASLIPISPRARTVLGNVALVGDCAGQVKATTGGGIIFGALCAGALAETIEKVASGKGNLLGYEHLWRHRYGTDLYMHRMIHGFYTKIDNRGLGFVFKAMKAIGMEEFFGRYGDMDRPSLMLKRFLFRGAFK